MAKDLKEILLNKVTPVWNRGGKDFDKDFAEHIVGAAVSFYENESWSDGFGVWYFAHQYPIPAKSWEDACKILVRTYDIWEPINEHNG